MTSPEYRAGTASSAACTAGLGRKPPQPLSSAKSSSRTTPQSKYCQRHSTTSYCNADCTRLSPWASAQRRAEKSPSSTSMDISNATEEWYARSGRCALAIQGLAEDDAAVVSPSASSP